MNNVITIIPSDNIAILDGVVVEFVFLIDSTIHAVQWQYTEGLIEYNDGKVPEKITDFTSFEYIMEERELAIESQIAVKEAEDEAAEAARDSALTPIERRRLEYPSIEEQLEALYAERHGDPSLIIAVDAAILIVNAKYPI